MKLNQTVFTKLRQSQTFTPVLVVGVCMIVGAVVYNFSAFAASAGFSFTAAALNYTVGDTITVAVLENSGTQCTSGTRAEFTYPADLLRYESSCISGSKFEGPIDPVVGNGSVKLQQYTIRKECGSSAPTAHGVVGEQLISNVTFTVLAAGSATLTFKDTSTAVSSTDNKTNVSPGGTSKTFALAAAPTPPPNTNPAPGPAPAPAPSPAPAPGPASRPKPVASTSVTPVDTATPVALNNNDAIQLETPADISPLPVLPDGVSKVEYILDGKLAVTETKSPFVFRLDTTKLLNGNHTLVTKTFYSNGQIKLVSQTVIAKNKFGLTQLKLRLQKLAWLVILVALLAGAAIAAWLIHRRGSGGNPYDDGSYQTADNYAPEAVVLSPPAQPNETTIVPSPAQIQPAQYGYQPPASAAPLERPQFENYPREPATADNVIRPSQPPQY